MKKKTLRSITLILLISLSMLKFAANAALIQGTDPRFGPNSLTIDTGTQLAWLNLSDSAGLSYNQVLADTAPGGIFSGYRFATTDEVLGLYSSAGIPGPGYYPSDSEPIQSLISLVGPTGLWWSQPGIIGITGSGDSYFQYSAGMYAYGSNSVVQFYVTCGPDGTGYGRTFSAPTVGSWLVTAVPEPSVCVITVAGLFGLAVARRKSLSKCRRCQAAR